MIHRTAREKLLFEARDILEGDGALDGIRGHSATIEPSDRGAARKVRVWHQDAEVAWTFSLEPGEERPPFYPDDIPYLPSLRTHVSWDDEKGLLVRWVTPLTEERKASFALQMDDFESWATSEDREVRSEQVREALDALMSKGLDDEVWSIVGEIVAFHASEGWEAVTAKAPSGPVRHVILRRGSETRTVVASSVGVPIVVMGEALAGT